MSNPIEWEEHYVHIIGHTHSNLGFAIKYLEHADLRTGADRERAEALRQELAEVQALILPLIHRWPTRSAAAQERLRVKLERIRELEEERRAREAEQQRGGVPEPSKEARIKEALYSV